MEAAPSSRVWATGLRANLVTVEVRRALILTTVLAEAPRGLLVGLGEGQVATPARGPSRLGSVMLTLQEAATLLRPDMGEGEEDMVEGAEEWVELDMERLGVVGEVLRHLLLMVQVGLTGAFPHRQGEGPEELGKMTSPEVPGALHLQEDTGVRGPVRTVDQGASNLEVPQVEAALEGSEGGEGPIPTTKSQRQLGARVMEGQLQEDTDISVLKLLLTNTAVMSAVIYY